MYIAQYGVGTASLNVAVALSIVLHRFAVWAGYEEREREGEKFVVGDRPQRDGARGTSASQCVLFQPTYWLGLFTVRPLILESLWAKNRVSTGAPRALNDPLVVQTKI